MIVSSIVLVLLGLSIKFFRTLFYLLSKFDILKYSALYVVDALDVDCFYWRVLKGEGKFFAFVSLFFVVVFVLF